MEKPHLHAAIILQVKVIYALLSAFGLLVIAGLDVYEGHLRFAGIAASFSLGLVLFSAYLLWKRDTRASAIPERVLVILLLMFTLFGMHQSASVVHWIYFVPIYTYFLMPYRWANIALIAYSVVLVAMVLHQFSLETRMQILFTYAACYVFSFMYALINERNNVRLSQIINSDPVTQVYNQNQFTHDLNKEIVRADRQHTELQLLAMKPPKEWRKDKTEEYEHNLVLFGKKIRRCLRQYDTCYRLNNDNFIVLMPQTELLEAKQVLQIVQRQLAELGQAQVILETYKVEDDSDSLLERVLQGLDHES